MLKATRQLFVPGRQAGNPSTGHRIAGAPPVNEGKDLKLLKFATAASVALALTATTATAQVNLTAETVSPGGSAYLAPAHLAEVASQRGIANIQLNDSAVLTNSVQNVAEGKTDVAVMPMILPFLLSRGVGPYTSLGAEKGAELAANLRMLAPYSLGVFFLMAFETEGISSWEDIKDKKVMNGPPRGAALNNARSIIQIVTGLKDGSGYEGVQADWGQVTAVISDGSVNLAVLPELFPNARTTELGAAGRMTAIDIPKDVFEGEGMQKYMKAPGNAPFVMPLDKIQASLGDSWTVVSDDDMFQGMSTQGSIGVNKDMDEDLAYQLTKAYIETLPALMEKAPFATSVGFDEPANGVCGPSPYKYHPGAIRAWEEAGSEIPDCAKP
jgi:TRAP-type uncharacterized transport system substrate-binding protein